MRARAPATLVRHLSPSQATDVERWWKALPTAERRALGRDAGRPPARLVGRFVEPGARSEGDDEDGLYDYLVNHEITLDDGRTYHICTAHPESRAAQIAGRVPAAFRCPRAEADCPMRALLDRAPGCDLRLSKARA
jgi:hypothetical protein